MPRIALPIDQLSHKRFSISLLLLIYLLAIALPAGAASAAPPPAGCYDETAATASAAAVVPAANQSVKIPKEKVDQAVNLLLWQQKLSNAIMVEGIVWSLFVEQESKMPPEVTPKYLDKFQQEYRDALNEYSQSADVLDNKDIIIHTILSAALDKPELAQVVPFVWEKLSNYTLNANGVEAFQNFGAEIAQSARRFGMSEQLLVRAPEILAEVYQCAHRIPEVAAAFDQFQQEQLNTSILDDSLAILNKNPDLAIPSEIRGRIDEDGAITISLDEIKALTQGEFNKLYDTIGEMKETLKEIDEQQDVIVDYLKDQELKAKYQELVKKKDAERQLKIDAAKASVSILATLASQIDPEAGQKISVFGNSLIQVTTAVQGWLKAASGLKGLDKVASLSTVVATGNILGAVMNVVALFGDQEPTPDQMILEEIGKLRQQVEDLRVEMHSRFDRVDEELNAIYTTMTDRFNQIDIQLGKINGNIQEVQQSLLALDLQLSRIERNNFELINDLGRRPLLDAINGGLNFEKRTGVPMPYLPEFVNFENTLQGWGTIHAYDAVNAGPTQRDYSDGQVLAELNAYPLDANLNYLNGWLLAHGMTPIATKRLPSPRDWLFAARAYTQLAMEWPEHAERIDPQRQAALVETGREIERAMENIATLQTPAGPKGNELLFTNVMTYYQGKLGAVDGSLQALENAFMNEVQSSRLGRADAFNLFGGIDQPLVYTPAELTTATCGNPAVYGSHPAPSSLKGMIPNYARYALADYLKLGTLNTCLRYELGQEIEHCFPEPEPPYSETCEIYYDTKAIVLITFDNVPIMSQTIEGGGGYLINDWYLHFSELEPHWTSGNNYKAQFEALTTVDTPSPDLAAQQAALLDATTIKLQTALAGYQQELYARILKEMTNGSLKQVARELAGGKALIDSFATLGLQNAVSNDEFLHAMLYGNQQLVDDSQILQSYAISLTEPITGMNLMVNPRLVIDTAANERAEAFTGQVSEYLDAITAQSYSETADYIGNGRRALDLTMRIVQLEAPGETPTPQPDETPEPGPGPSADSRHIYLPAVAR